jgi:hypothetical protein
MKHIEKFEEGALNEGFWSWLFKKIYKVNYTAELTDKDGQPVSYKSYLTIKAKDEDDARKKFDEKWEEAVKSFDTEPTVIVGNVKKTDKADKTSIDLPKAIKKIRMEKEVKKEVKKDDKKKEEKK